MIDSSKREYPNDADGDVLQRLSDGGFDFSNRHDVDFYCYASNYEKAEQISSIASEQGYECDITISEDEDDPLKKHSVYMTVNIHLNYEGIIARQASLNDWLKSFKTHCDGWGVMSNA